MLIWLLACTGTTEPVSTETFGEGLLGDGGTTETLGKMAEGQLNPFPSMHVLSDAQIALPDIVPFEEATPIPVDRLAWRTGFSPAQPAVIHLPAVDATTLPGWRAPTPGAGGVVLADLTAKTWLPVMAELDAHPDADPPSLIIRPLVAMPVGHQVAIGITSEVAPRPAAFQAVLDGSHLPDWTEHYRDVEATLTEMGADGLSVFWDFPVASGARPLESALEQLAAPGSWTLDRVRNLEEGDTLAGSTWRAADGSFQAQDFLVDDLTLDLADDGSVRQTGEVAADLYIHIPTSVADADAGTVPVMLFGHGILSRPEDYLDDKDDPSGVLALAEAGGYIVIGSTWRGLTFNDRADAVIAASDIGRLPLVPDRLVQSQVNAQTLARLIVDGDLLEDPVFRGASGQSLPARDQLFYYGISLGGIEGAVLVANDAPIDAAVLHVPGAAWATMLERSSNWTAFELFVTATVEDPRERQFLYALSQLWWDPADPISYVTSLTSKNVLLQEAIGDEQVPNMTTRMLARSIDLPIVTPLVEQPWGLETVEAPLPAGSRGLVQFDPEKPLPADVNRPAAVTGAHTGPRLWYGTEAQTRSHLSSEAPAQITHHCGEGPCSSSTPGLSD